MSAIDPIAIFEREWKLYGPRFEYAWRYFDFHAKQRTTMFNFFLLFSGLMLNGCFLLFQQRHSVLLFFASILGIAITFMFLFLERRNEELVHVAEDILRAVERDVLFLGFSRQVKWPKQRKWFGRMIEQDTTIDLGIFTREDKYEAQHLVSRYRHGVWLPRVQMAIAALYFLFALASIYLFLRPPSGLLV
jgi:hypothetical protein